MKNIWENAPSKATHYQPSKSEYENEVYFKITNCHVETAWVPVGEEGEEYFPVEGDYCRMDYTWDEQPVVRWESLIVRTADTPKTQPMSLAKWLLDKVGSGSSDVELGYLTMSQAMQITRELEQEDNLHNFAVTVYSDNSAYVQRRSYCGEENEETDQYIFGFMLKEPMQ